MYRFRLFASRRAKSKSIAQRLARAVISIQPLERRTLMSGTVTFGPLANEVDVGAHQGSFAVQTADINGDGETDIVTANYDGTVTLALGNGNGTFKTPQTVSDGLATGVSGNEPELLTIATINDKPVILVGNGSDMIDALEINTNGNLVSEGPEQITPGTDINGFTVASVYGGYSYLVTANEDGSVTSRPFAAAGDGVSSGFNGFSGAHNYSSVITYNSGASTAALIGVVTGGFIKSGDGADLAVLGENGTVSLVPGDYSNAGGFNFGTGTAQTTDISQAGTSAADIYAANLTSDGFTDLLVVNDNGTITPLLGGGSADPALTSIFTAKPVLTPPTGTNTSPLVIGDFNGDGREDFAFAEKPTAGNYYEAIFFLGNGDGTFGSPQTLAIGSEGQTNNNKISAGDFNGDGESDLLAYRYASNSDYSQNLQVALSKTPASPTFTSATSATVNQGSAFSFTVKTNGYPASTITESGALPKGLTFKNNGDGTATISGTASTQTKSAFVLNLTATNGFGTATQTLTLNVDQPARFTSANQVTFVVNDSASFTVKTTGGLPKTTLTANNLPAGLTFTDNGNGTGTISGAPSAPGISSPPVVITATSGTFVVTQNITVTVNSPPQITSGTTAIFIQGQVNSFTVTVADAVPKATTTFKGKIPRGVTVVKQSNGNLLISGTPRGRSAGTYTLTINSKNSAGAATPVTLTLTVENPATIVAPSSGTFIVGKKSSVTIKDTKGAFPTPQYFEEGALPSGVTFGDDNNGTATLGGTPAAGSGGIYPLTFIAVAAPTASDINLASLTESGTMVSATVEPISVTSLTESDTTVTATVGSTAGIATGQTVMIAGASPSGYNGVFVVTGVTSTTFTYTAVSGLVTPATGSITATPEPTGITAGSIVEVAGATPAGYNGTFIVNAVTPTGFTYTAASGLGAQTGTSLTVTPELASTAKYTLTVLEPAAFTSAANDTFTVGTAGTFAVTTTGFPTPSISANGLPSGVTLVDNGDGTATIAGTPAAGTSGDYNVVLTAHTSGGSATQKFTLQVDQVPGFAGLTPVAVSSLSESGTTVTATVASTTALTSGSVVTIAGATPSGYNGSFIITVVNGTTFTYTAASGLTTASGTITALLAPTVNLTEGTAVSKTLTFSGFPTPITISNVAGLPDGVTLTTTANGTELLVNGTPTESGTFTATFTLTNFDSETSTLALLLNIAS